jgi:signal transduction histidine kinase
LPDGTTKYFLSKKSPMKDSHGNAVGIIGVSFDITARREAEIALEIAKKDAEDASRVKSDFLRNMHHDIRTPVAALIGMAEILRMEIPGDDIDRTTLTRYASEISNAGNELLRFLNNMLESVQASSGNIPLVEEKFDLYQTIDQLMKLHQPIATKQKLDFTSWIDPQIPPNLLSDSSRIYRILLEFLINALKFTQAGSVYISVSLAKKEGVLSQFDVYSRRLLITISRIFFPKLIPTIIC